MATNFKILILFSTFINIFTLTAQQSTDTSLNKAKDIKIVSGTFLGNEKRNFYGDGAPTKLDVIWKIKLGSGKTVVTKSKGEEYWAGSGWTGQPLLVKENDSLFIIQGAFDHNLKKISAKDGKIVWQYKFDDIIKGTATIWENTQALNPVNRFIIMQGSRRGLHKNLSSEFVPSFRAISYLSGQELWRLNVKKTKSYSRDVDGSALIVNDTAYIGLENAIFTVFNPDPQFAMIHNNMLQPKIFQEIMLYNDKDYNNHGGNLVVESSPCKLGNHIYISAGSGHIFGYNLKSKEIDWDFFIGSDIDGSPVATDDSCIIVTVEKQYILGNGGAFKLNPKKTPDSCVVWYFPTENKDFSTWQGGVIGSAAINDFYRDSSDVYLAAFNSIDGHLYVVNHKKN